MSTPRWFYAENDTRLGPVPVEQIAHLIMSGGLARAALVWLLIRNLIVPVKGCDALPG